MLCHFSIFILLQQVRNRWLWKVSCCYINTLLLYYIPSLNIYYWNCIHITNNIFLKFINAKVKIFHERFFLCKCFITLLATLKFLTSTLMSSLATMVKRSPMTFKFRIVLHWNYLGMWLVNDLVHLCIPHTKSCY